VGAAGSHICDRRPHEIPLGSNGLLLSEARGDYSSNDRSVLESPSDALKKVTIDGGVTNQVDWTQTVASKHDDAETDTSLWDL
jgi:hypothetical protein